MTAIYFDLETAGLEPHHPDIQLAAIAMDEESGSEIEAFEVKIKFDPTKADPDALALNHYLESAWEKSWHAGAVVAEFSRFLNKHKSLTMVSRRTGNPYRVAKLVGHNAATFDGPRLRAMYDKYSTFLPADPRVRCTCQRAMWWFDERRIAPTDYKLATLCDYFGIPINNSHEALADVRATIALARALSERPVAA